MIFEYFTFTLLLFFMAFFLDIFYQYFRYKVIQPRKMLTVQKGGLFEHYIIVGIILAGVALLHIGFELNPFDGSNWLSIVLQSVSTFVVTLLFTLFLSVFLIYIGLYIYAAYKKIENPGPYVQTKAQVVLKIAFITAIIISLALVIFGLVAGNNGV